MFLVVGDQEMKNREVNIRNRDDTSSQDRGKPVPITETIEKLVALRDGRGMHNPFATVQADAPKVDAPKA
jgi:threonyl-tRNA synthetase